MEVKELRIGNYVCFSDSGLTFRVESISAAGLGVSNSDKESWCEIERFEAIPLTREWLLKFGLVESEKDCRTFFSKGYFKLEFSNGGNSYYKRKFISSVHQLQNLYFALNQQELELL